MAAYLETTRVVLLAVFGILIGRAFSRLPKPYWAIGYIAPFLLAGMVILARRVGALQQVEPFSWLMAGRREVVALAIAYTMLMTTALARLPLKRQRVVVNVFMAIAVTYFSILPFALPAGKGFFGAHYFRGLIDKTRKPLGGDGGSRSRSAEQAAVHPVRS